MSATSINANQRAESAAVPDAGQDTVGPPVGARLLLTRRGLQVALGLFWLLDGALQLQPYMLRASFGQEVIASAADGQPAIVASPVHWAADLIAAHPVAWDVPFAAIQLLLGVGLLLRRSAPLALAASIPWVLGVWYFGEGLSGLLSGDVGMLGGAPGAVLLYGILAIAAWPQHGRSNIAPAQWLRVTWLVIWFRGVILQLLPANNSGRDVADGLRDAGAPGWLSDTQTSLAGWIESHGLLSVALLVIAQLLIGLAVLDTRTVRPGIAIALVFLTAMFVFAQNFGDLYTGESTDPNTAPLLALMAIAVLSARDRTKPGSVAAPSPTVAASEA